MKTITTAFVLLFPIGPSLAAVQDFHTWAQSYGAGSNLADYYYGSGFDVPVGIAKLSDASIVVTGQLDLPECQSGHTGDSASGTLVRYAATGGILWQKQLRINGLLGNCVTQNVFTFNDNILVTGIKRPSAEGGGGVFLFVAKFDSSGKVLWQASPTQTSTALPNGQSTPIIAGTQLVSSSLTADGGIVACSYSYTANNSHTNPAIIKISGIGKIEFIEAYEQQVTQYMNSSAVCQLHGLGGYAMALDYPVTAEATPSVAVLITNNSGGLKRKILIPNDSLVWGEHAVSILSASNGDLVVLSNRSGNVDSGMILRRLRLDGTIVFAKYFPNTGMIPSTLTQTNSGGFLIGGHCSVAINGITTSDVALMKLSYAGVLQSFRTIGGPAQEPSNGNNGTNGDGTLIPTSDGGYAFAISTNSYITGTQDKPDWWIGKTDATFHIQNFTGPKANLPINGIIAQDQTSIAFPLSTFTAYPIPLLAGAPPNLVIKDLAAKTGGNKPTVQIQAVDSFVAP